MAQRCLCPIPGWASQHRASLTHQVVTEGPGTHQASPLLHPPLHPWPGCFLALLGLLSCLEPPASTQGVPGSHTTRVGFAGRPSARSFAHIKSVAQDIRSPVHPLTCPLGTHSTPHSETHHPGARGAASGAGHLRAQSTGPTGGTAPRGSRPGCQGSPACCKAGNRSPDPSRYGPR